MAKDYTKEIEDISKNILYQIHRRLRESVRVHCPVENKLKKPKKIFGYFRLEKCDEEEITEEEVLWEIPLKEKEIRINKYITIEFGDWKIEETGKSLESCDRCGGRTWEYLCSPNSVTVYILGLEYRLDKRYISSLKCAPLDRYLNRFPHLVYSLTYKFKELAEFKKSSIKELLSYSN